MSPVRGVGGKSRAVTVAITSALGGQTDMQVTLNSLAPYAAQKIGERYATAKEAADKGGEILITTAASYGAGKALEPVVFSISKSGVVSKATNYFKNFGGRNKIGLNKTFKGIEKKSNQADGVLVQIDLSKDEMANIANRMWGKNNGKSITVIIFQNSSNSVFEFKRP